MNSVNLTGRLTRDPEVRYTADQKAVARFSIAVDRYTRPGEEKQADFPNIVAFGKTAERVETFLNKGRMVGISGHIQTGSYINKDGVKVFTTDVIAERVDFLDPKGSQMPERRQPAPEEPLEGFAQLDEDVPF